MSLKQPSADFDHLAKERLSNKAGWALNDILEECEFSRPLWKQAMSKAEKAFDTELVILLARLRDNLAAIERKAGDALRGEYRD